MRTILSAFIAWSSACLFATALLLVTRDTASGQGDAPAPTSEMTFANMTLADAQARGVATAPSVSAAKARVDENQAAFDLARGLAAPSLVTTYVQVPQGNPPGPNITSRQVTAGLQFSLVDLFSSEPRTREAALTLAATQFDERSSELQERIKVVTLYYDALAARALVAARRAALDAATSGRESARIRVKAGDAPGLDVIRADVDVASAEADLAQAEAADANATEALAVETGSSADAFATAAAPGTTPPNANPVQLDPAAAVARARAARPEIVSAHQTIEAAKVAIARTRIENLLPITVTGGYLNGTDSGVPVSAPAINAQMTVPLSSAAHERVRAARAAAVEAQAKAQDVERQIVLEVAAAARTYAASLRAASAASRARVSAEAELRATELGYRNGASSSLEVASARATYTQAAVDELSTLYTAQKAGAILSLQVGE